MCYLARFPARWNHLAEKESRQINMLEQILFGEVMQLRRDLLYVSEQLLPMYPVCTAPQGEELNWERAKLFEIIAFSRPA